MTLYRRRGSLFERENTILIQAIMWGRRHTCPLSRIRPNNQSPLTSNPQAQCLRKCITFGPSCGSHMKPVIAPTKKIGHLKELFGSETFILCQIVSNCNNFLGCNNSGETKHEKHVGLTRDALLHPTRNSPAQDATHQQRVKNKTQRHQRHQQPSTKGTHTSDIIDNTTTSKNVMEKA